jgi:acyl carrier protein
MIAEALEEDVVHREDALENFEEWDSLTALSIVARVIDKYGVELSAADLEAIVTVGDLEDLVHSKRVEHA